MQNELFQYCAGDIFSYACLHSCVHACLRTCLRAIRHRDRPGRKGGKPATFLSAHRITKCAHVRVHGRARVFFTQAAVPNFPGAPLATERCLCSGCHQASVTRVQSAHERVVNVIVRRTVDPCAWRGPCTCQSLGGRWAVAAPPLRRRRTAAAQPPHSHRTSTAQSLVRRLGAAGIRARAAGQPPSAELLPEGLCLFFSVSF